MSDTEQAVSSTKQNNGISIGDAIVLIAIWATGGFGIWAITQDNSGEANVSFENAIGYICIAVSVVSVCIIFRDVIAQWMRRNI